MPNCSTCNEGLNIPVLYAQALYPTSCSSSSCASECSTDIRCVKWDGPNLTCSEITTGMNLEEVIMKIDEKLCAVTGNYSTYNVSCLDATNPVLTEQQFVETISEYVCTVRSDLDIFIGTSFLDYQTQVDNRFNNIEAPELTCASAAIISSDSLSTVYTKYCAKFAQLDAAISLNGVNWGACFTLTTDPITIAQGFTAILDQLCIIKGDVGSGSSGLPTFNNVGSCLPGSLTSADSLSDTVNKLKNKVCTQPTFDINSLAWGCTTKPSTETTNLQAAFQAVLDKVDDYLKNKLTFDAGDFTVSQVNGGDPCQGKLVALAVPSDQDRFFALNGGDTAPGTWATKVTAGTGITFDYATTPGTVIINASGGAGTDTQVKTRSADPTTGYLEDKIKGGTANGLTITKTTDVGDNTVQINSTINWTTFVTAFLGAIEDNPTLKEAFCDMVESCLPDCITPPNVTVVYNTGETTTSTSTTTTTTL